MTWGLHPWISRDLPRMGCLGWALVAAAACANLCCGVDLIELLR